MGPERPPDEDDRLGRLEAAVSEGFAALERHRQSSEVGVPDRLEEIVELLESAIDHLVGLEKRLAAIEAAGRLAEKRASKATPAGAGPAEPAGRTAAARARRNKSQDS